MRQLSQSPSLTIIHHHSSAQSAGSDGSRTFFPLGHARTTHFIKSTSLLAEVECLEQPVVSGTHHPRSTFACVQRAATVQL